MNDSRTTGDALTIATNWITASDLPFVSAFIGGSVAYADPDAAYDSASDIDCYLILADDNPPDSKIGKIVIDDVLLDVSWIAWSQIAEPDAVMASLLHFGRVVRDDGKLGPLQQQISADFHSPEMIAIRLQSMRTKIRNGLVGDSSHLSTAEQVMNWLFPATLATHIPLIAACAPLTVRKRFLAAKNTMAPSDYEELLSLFGFDSVTAEQTQRWLNATADLFDATARIAAGSQRFWATDIHVDARHIAIGGSQQLIDAGNHREALYWIIATSSRCLTVRADAGEDSREFVLAYEHMLRDVGIETADQRQGRSTRILQWIDS